MVLIEAFASRRFFARFPARYDAAETRFGGLIAFVGFMLSPLSWWNDLLVNVPLALAFAWLISWFAPGLFTWSFVAGYWATNVLGLVMLQKGAGLMVHTREKLYSRKSLLIDLGISLAYTGIIILLVQLGVLKPIIEYLPRN